MGITHVLTVGIDIPFAIGEMILGVEAYFLRDWRVLQMVAHAPIILLATVYWLCPESVRWCLAKVGVLNSCCVLVSAKFVPSQHYNLFSGQN